MVGWASALLAERRTHRQTGRVNVNEYRTAPARFIDAWVGGAGGTPFPCAMPDSGGGVSLLGKATYDWLARHHPDSVRTVSRRTRALPLEGSVGGVSGVGLILRHVDIDLSIGGRRFVLEDVGVIDGFEGLILGNEFSERFGITLDYRTHKICMDHPDGRFCTSFSTSREDAGALASLAVGHGAPTPTESRSSLLAAGGVPSPQPAQAMGR